MTVPPAIANGGDQPVVPPVPAVREAGGEQADAVDDGRRRGSRLPDPEAVAEAAVEKSAATT